MGPGPNVYTFVPLVPILSNLSRQLHEPGHACLRRDPRSQSLVGFGGEVTTVIVSTDTDFEKFIAG